MTENTESANVQSIQTETPRADPRREGVVWMALGLFLFGLVLGIGGGFSGKEGSAVTILSGVLSFVGGTFLGYTGFRRRRTPGKKATEVDSVRVGSGLTCLSLGVLAGLFFGMRYRDTPIGDQSLGPPDMTTRPPASDGSPPPTAKDGGSRRLRTWKLNASGSPICRSLRGRVYTGPAAIENAKHDLETAVQALCEVPTMVCKGAQDRLAAGYPSKPEEVIDDLREFVEVACERAPQ